MNEKHDNNLFDIMYQKYSNCALKVLIKGAAVQKKKLI